MNEIGELRPRNVHGPEQRIGNTLASFSFGCLEWGRGTVFRQSLPKHDTMKTSPKALMLALVASTLFTASTFASETKPNFRINEENFAKLNRQEQARVLEIGARWDAITNMDRSDLNRADRKELRAEVKALRAEAKSYDRGGTTIYLSTAAIIIIILLLILIL